MTTQLAPPATFTSLERRYYTSPDVLEQELDRVIARQWILFSHASELPEPRDVLVRDLGAESIIVPRDADGELHGFFNVCRHRGSQICDPGKSTAKQLVCPYHRWSYGLDGRLLGTPHMRKGVEIDYADYGLRPVHLEVWRGFIYVALGTEPPETPINEAFHDGDEHLDVFELEDLRLAHEVTYDVNCNWKLLVENFLECYHCAGSHPELCNVMVIQDTGGVQEINTSPAQTLVIAATPPEGVVSQTLTGKAASNRFLGRIADEPELPPQVGSVVNPTLSAVQAMPDYVVTHRMLPVTVDRTQLVSEWYVHPDAVAGRDYDLDDLIAVWHVTNEQDIELSERNQRGVNSRSFVPGPNSRKQEPMIRDALTLYAQMMDDRVLFERLVAEWD